MQCPWLKGFGGIRLKLLRPYKGKKGCNLENCVAKMDAQKSRKSLKRACPRGDEDEGPPKRKSCSSSSFTTNSTSKSIPSPQANSNTPDTVLDYARRSMGVA